MKLIRLYLTIVILFSLSFAKAQTDWNFVSQPGTNLFIVNETTGYSYVNSDVGSHGQEYTLEKSTDGLQTFETIRTKTGDFGCYSLDEMFFLNANEGYIAEVCEGYTTFYGTIDGGTTWFNGEYGGWSGLSMFFLDVNLGYYTYYPGGEDETSYLESGGTPVYSTQKYRFVKNDNQYPDFTTEIYFVNGDNGFIICSDTLDNAVILKTINAGMEWSEKKVLADVIFNDIHFPSDEIGFVIGSNGLVLKTIDGGESWETIENNITEDLLSIDFSGNYGYIVGDNGTVLISDDQGDTWSVDSYPNATDLSYVRVFGEHAYVNDVEGNLYSNGLSGMSSDVTIPNVAVYPNPVSGMMTVELPTNAQNVEIKLFDIVGKCVLNANTKELDVSNLASGVYLLTVISEHERYKTRIVKE
ncbi:MAG: YCF48-related protein [Salinivirgaceae bacterium]|jgi:photosystem II stability/assembly factor-like uncharacterized protein|nr:YCF48-related protein [Salinivirgaceae bacterium]